MESPNADSSSDSTKERLIVKAKRPPPQEVGATNSPIHYDRNVALQVNSRTRLPSRCTISR